MRPGRALATAQPGVLGKRNLAPATYLTQWAVASGNRASPALFHLAMHRRTRQVLLSIPHYFREVRTEVRSLSTAYQWLYFKVPYLFPLSRFPNRVTLEPTNSCNFSCPHCRRSVMTRAIGAMGFDLFRKLAVEISQWPRTIVKLGGLGEPSTHPHFEKQMELLAELGIRVILYTNGTLLRLYPAERILSWNLHTLVVSVDGVDESSFERLRVGGSFAQTVESVSEFHRAKRDANARFPVEIRHVIMPSESNEQLARFKREWMERADTVKFNFLMPLRPAGASSRRGRCRDIRRELYIRWDGRVPQCGYNTEWMADARESSIQEIWMHPRLQELRRSHRKRDMSGEPHCRSCAFQ